MAHWNYRVLREGTGDEAGYRLIEVLYDDSGAVFGWSEAAPYGDDITDLLFDLELMSEALDKPTLTLDQLPHAPEGLE